MRRSGAITRHFSHLANFAFGLAEAAAEDGVHALLLQPEDGLARAEGRAFEELLACREREEEGATRWQHVAPLRQAPACN